MFKLLLIGLIVYLGYSLYLRYTNQEKVNRPKKTTTSKKYSKLDISDAEFKDIDED